MAEGGKPLGTGFLVLSLGLLIGFVIGFVLLLSRLPVDPALGSFRSGETDVADDYEFFTVLPDERVALPNEVRVEPAPALETVRADVAVPPPARVVEPADYLEVPAASRGDESYFLQAGNYRDAAAAERARARVLMLGLDAFIVTRRDARGATGHRVRIGPYVDKERLTAAKQRLRRGGVPYEIVRVTG